MVAVLSTGAGTLSGTATEAAVAGVANFAANGLSIDIIGADKVLTFSATGLTTVNTSAFAITHAPVAALAITTQPAVTTVAGVGFAIQPVVEILDAFGNLVSTGAGSTLTVDAAKTTGTGTLSGTTSRVASFGVASFGSNGLSINLIGADKVLTFSATGATDAVSSAFAITHAGAAALTITNQPSVSTVAGVAFVQQPEVQIRDAFGNLVSTGAGSTLTVLATLTTGTGTLTDVGAGNQKLANAGVADYFIQGLKIDLVGTDKVLTFSSGGLTTADTNAFAITHAAATQVVLSTPGTDFTADNSTNLTVQARDVFGNVATSDNTTNVTFSPTLSGTISAVVTGNGDGVYNVVGDAEIVTVAAGVATITLKDVVAETFEVAFTNDASLTDPANDSIIVTHGVKTQVVITRPGSDFAPGAGTFLTVQVHDAFGNLVLADSATVITFLMSGSGTIIDVATGLGDGGYGVVQGTESVTVAAGVATIVLEDTVAETLTVTILNNASLTAPAPDSIEVSSLGMSQVGISTPGTDFDAGFTTNLTVQVQDTTGALITTDNTTQITFSPTLGGTISAVVAGTGDGVYNVVAGAESVTVAGGVATVVLTNIVAETFEVAITNSLSSSILISVLTNPVDDSILVSPDVAAQVVITGAGADFEPGAGTFLTVEVQDQYGNLRFADNAIDITFSPTLSGTITDGVTGTGDGVYGIAGAAETVTVAGGVATVILTDKVAETFEVAITNDAGLTDPANDSIIVSLLAGAATQVVITGPGTDFAAGGSTTLTVQVQDQFGNLISTDNTTAITFDPTLSGTISGVVTGVGDGVYSSTGAAETVTVVGGVAAVTLTDTAVETFEVALTNSASLDDPPNDSITVGEAPAGQLVVTTQPSVSNVAGEPLAQQPVVEIRDAFGNLIATGASSTATVTATVFSGTGTLLGTTTTVAAGGVATFADLFMEIIGSKEIRFTADGISAAISTDLTITHAGASQLVLTLEPSATTVAGVPFATQPVVQILDQFGNLVSTGPSSIWPVTASLTGGSGTLSGAVTAGAVGGVVNFAGSGLSIDLVGSDKVLTFSTNVLTPDTSAPFAITYAAATQLVVTTEPSATTVAGVAFAQQPVVEFRDAFGNLRITGGLVTATLTEGDGTLLGTVTEAAVGGVADFAGNGLSIDLVGTDKVLTFSASGMTPDSTGPFAITNDVADHLVFSAQPETTVAGENILLAVTIEDQFNNTVTNADRPITLNITTNPSGATLNGTISVSSVNGVATWTAAEGLNISLAGEGYRVAASASNSPLFLIVSGLFDITDAPLTVTTLDGSTVSDLVGGKVDAAYDVEFFTVKPTSTKVITITFPSGYDIGAAATVEDAAATAGAISVGAADGIPVTVTTDPGARQIELTLTTATVMQSPTTFSILTGITNPVTPGTTTSFEVRLDSDVSGTLLDENLDVPGVFITGQNLYVAIAGNDANDCLTPGNACRTIGNAITIANIGATINVAAGTYIENVVIGKPLTLQGEGNPTTIIAPASGNGVSIRASSTTIDSFVIAPQATSSAMGIRIDHPSAETSGITISNNTITTLEGGNHAIWVGGSSQAGGPTIGLLVEGNTINAGDGSIGFHAAPSSPSNSDWVIDGNTFTDHAGPNLELNDVDSLKVVNNKFGVATGDESVRIISDLSDLAGPIIFGGNDVAGSSAGSMVSFLTLSGSTMNDVNVGGNAFDGWADRALLIGAGVTTTHVRFNAYLQSGGEALRNDSAAPVDASVSWWGTIDEDFIATTSTAAGLVDFTPFLATSTEVIFTTTSVEVIDPSEPGFRGDRSTLYVTTLGEQSDGRGRVQEAVDRIPPAPQSDINVYPGVYADNIFIDKPDLTLRSTDGAGTTSTPITEITGISPTTVIAIDQAPNITLGGAAGQGFVIRGAPPAAAEGALDLTAADAELHVQPSDLGNL